MLHSVPRNTMLLLFVEGPDKEMWLRAGCSVYPLSQRQSQMSVVSSFLCLSGTDTILGSDNNCLNDKLCPNNKTFKNLADRCITKGNWMFTICLNCTWRKFRSHVVQLLHFTSKEKKGQDVSSNYIAKKTEEELKCRYSSLQFRPISLSCPKVWMMNNWQGNCL